MAEAEGSSVMAIAEESVRVYFSMPFRVLSRKVNDERRPLQHGYPQVPQGRRSNLATRDRNGGTRGARQRTTRGKRIAQAAGHLVDPGARSRACRRWRNRNDLASSLTAPQNKRR